jgi:branched-subunit amino acid aminotransferase/4-amino-4-deoxychorismate lyase
MLVDWNGRLVDESEATLRLSGAPTTLSDGLYETLRCYSGRPFDLDSHLRRLAEGCRSIYIPYDPAQDRFKARILALLDANELTATDSRIRIVVHRNVNWESAHPVNICILAWPVAAQALDEQRRKGVSAMIPSERRQLDAPLFKVKTLNLLSTVLAQAEAKSIHADEALILNSREELCEATYSNVFVMRPDDHLVTPPISSPCLPGITRAHVLRLARREGWQVIEQPVGERELRAAREIFLTSSVSELMAVTTLNGHPVGDGTPGPVCNLVQAKYRRAVQAAVAAAG